MKKVKKPKLSKDTYSALKMERYLGALNEMHGENLKGIKEGFIVVNRKLDSHTEMIGELKEDVSELKEDVSTLKSDMQIVKTDVSVLKTDVSSLKSDMQIVKGDISIIKSDLKKRVDYDEFINLVKRVQKIEAKI